jgi:hypothetical protein
MEAPQLHKTKATDIAFTDPLSDETRKTRTHLLFAATLSVVVKAYELKITKAPWLDLDVPVNAPEVLEGALSAALCYLLFVFVIYGWQDFRRWRIGGEIQLVHGSFDLVLQSRESLRIIALQLEKLQKGDSLEPAIRTSIEVAAAKLPESQARLASLQSGMKRLNWLQWFRVIVVELAFPVALGAFALFKLSAALLPFLAAVTR